MIKSIIAVLFSLISLQLFAQTYPKNNGVKTGELVENPLKQIYWFYDMRKDRDGNLPVGKRWESYLKMRSQTLNKKTMLPAANWENLGPNSTDSLTGRMISHAFDPSDNNIIWAGAGSGGLWRSTDAAETWEPMTDNIPSLEISDVEINPLNRDIMLIGTGVDRFPTVTLRPGIGVLKSTDRGLTWNLTGFSYQTISNVSVSKIIWHPSGADTVYLAASNGFWKSSDAGQNWTMHRSGRVSALVINKTTPNILYAAFRTEGIFKSTDSGVSWNQILSGLPSGSNIGLTSMSICDDFPENIITAITDATTFALTGLYKTTDGGQTWNQINNAPNVSCQPGGSQPCIGWFTNVCAISPVNPDLIFLGGVQFWRSSDGGTNWTWHDYLSNGLGYTNYGLTYVDQWDFGFDPVDPNTMYAFNDGGVQKSTNGGTHWKKKSKNLITSQIYRLASSPSDTTRLLAGFQDHGLQKLDYINNNKEWNRWSANDGTAVIVDPTNSDIFYGSFFNGVHFKNSAGGVNWIQTTVPIQNGITESGPQFSPLVMDLQNPNTLYCASTLKIYKTTNGGNLWNPVANIPNVFTIAVNKINSNIVYAHSYTSTSWTVWRSNDSGQTWNGINHPSIPSWRVTDLECDPIDEGTMYAIRNSANPNNDHIKKSTDYGETWINITNNLPDIPVNAITMSEFNNNHIYLATDLGVFATTDGGQDWFEYNDGLPLTYASDIHYHPLDRTIRISTIGRGVWKTKAIDAKISNIGNENISSPDEFVIYNNYPNPFNPSTSIRFDIRTSGTVKLIIYNELGQQIRSLIDGEYSTGEHTVTWDAKNDIGLKVPSGIYYARIINKGLAKSIKMMLLK